MSHYEFSADILLQEPVEESSLDSSLATEKALEDIRLEEQGELPQSSASQSQGEERSTRNPNAQEQIDEIPLDGFSAQVLHDKLNLMAPSHL